VPKLANVKLDDAVTQLEKLHLVKGTTNLDWSDTIKAGYVISTTPPAGTQLRRGEHVDLLVSKGASPVTVPDVVGKTYDDAKSILEAAGLKVTRNDVFSDTVPQNTVVSQNPAKGAEGHRGDAVTLDVSKGPQLFPVPDVVGQKVNDAMRILREAGFDPQVSQFGGNTVRYQNPGAGAQRKKGTQVQLVAY
jgi:serine/threonine-protein kinase